MKTNKILAKMREGELAYGYSLSFPRQRSLNSWGKLISLRLAGWRAWPLHTRDD